MREPRKTNLGQSAARRWWRGASRRGTEPSPQRGHDHLAISEQTGCSVGESGWFGDKVIWAWTLWFVKCRQWFLLCVAVVGKAHRHAVIASFLLSILSHGSLGFAECRQVPRMLTLRMTKASCSSKSRASMSRKYPSRKLKALAVTEQFGILHSKQIPGNRLLL